MAPPTEVNEMGAVVSSTMGNKFAKGNDMRSRRSARDASRMQRGTYIRPPASACDPIEPGAHIELSDTSRIVQRLVHRRGRLVDYALVHEVRGADEEWHEVAKIDCCHSQVHRHTAATDQPETDRKLVIQELFSWKDVEDSWDAAYGDIEDNWERRERDWLNGRANGQ
jgi:hypothetical protein